MKRIILSMVTMLLLTGLVRAQQQLDNAGFELWDTLGDYTQPTNWYSLNPLAEFGFEPSTTITSDAHSGNYAVVLESKSNQFSDYTGLLCTGPILDGNMEPDFSRMKIPFSGNPSGIQLYYKAFPQAGDTSVFSMVLTRWNTAQQRTDTIADVVLMIADSVEEYTLADLVFDYKSPLPADSAFVVISSSLDGFNPTAGSKIQLDDIEIIYSATGVKELSPLSVSVYPNPVKDILTIDLKDCETAMMELYDQAGRQVYQTLITKENNTTRVTGFDQGIYFMMLHTEDGAEQHFKLIIQR